MGWSELLLKSVSHRYSGLSKRLRAYLKFHPAYNVKNLLAVFALLTLFISTPSLAQFEPGIGVSNEPNIPNVELEKRQGAEHRLEAFGTDLLGDGIDPHTGSISFTTTDVSIPGNFSLPVMIERTRSQGLHYNRTASVEFGDWQLNVPRIHVLTRNTNNWTGNRCTNTTIQSFPSYSVGRSGSLWTAGDYTVSYTHLTLPTKA